MIRIIYENEKTVEVDNLDLTLLEISLTNEIPHVHACGGMARCSTCRVIVLENSENCLPPNEMEIELADKKGFEHNIRLGCQMKVKGPLKLRRLVFDESDIKLSAQNKETTGKEKRVAIMFTDIRNFTGFSEKHLCYDIVHILNRYFFEMGRVINENDGYIDKYMGDGIMAIFGLENEDPFSICRSAVKAGLEMFSVLKSFNVYLEKYFNTSFQIGVGIHFGEALVGELGHPSKTQFSAIGDVVNIASRVESATKAAKAPFLITEAVYSQIKNIVKTGKIVRDAELKGKHEKYTLLEVLDMS
ncbi:MAG: adenylate/guanylate cyclase domain-containing protein [Thermodesulfobacteriota bacterium]